MSTAVTDPVTRELLVSALYDVGVRPGMIIEVHGSLSSFHYVIGGARTVVDALLESAQKGGTILMPMQTGDNTEPSEWVNPPVQADLYREVRDSIPAWDKNTSDIPNMGAIAENFRHREGVVTSSHPTVSYAAWGRYAKLLCNRQSLHFPLAEESPCARLYELKGYVLLLGTDFDSVTCMHLAEYRNDCRPIKISGASVATDSGTEWKKYLDLQLDSEVFKKIRPIMARKNMIRETELGGCKIQFFSAADAIEEAMHYFEKTVVYELYR